MHKGLNRRFWYSLLFCLLVTFLGKAQEHDFNLYYEQTGEGEFTIFAENQEYYPISIRLNFTLTNIELADDGYKVYTVPEKTKRVLTTLKVISKTNPSNFSFTSFYNMGDDSLENYDEDYEYQLPYQKGTAHKLIQGYDGAFSHKNQKSLDFSMPIGTEITAIREGIVVKVEDSYDQNCPSIECAKYNNFVTIYHADGTFASYIHLKKDGALVNVGDKITKGQTIALSGNTGFSSAPHLHLEVFKQKLNHKETLSTKFVLENGEVDLLIENKYYKRAL